MTKEAVLKELREEISETYEYRITNFLVDKLGLLLTGISLLAAFIIYGSRVVSWMVTRVECRYWNIDERFVLEDSHASIKAGVYLFSVIVSVVAQSILRRAFDVYCLNSCKIYVIEKEIKKYDKEIRRENWKLRRLKIQFVLFKIFKSGENKSIDNADNIEQLTKVIAEQKRQISAFRKYKKVYNKTFRIIKKYFRRKLVLGLGTVLVSSFIITISTDFDFGTAGIKNMMASVAILTASFVIGSYIGGWCDTKGRFKVIYNDFLKSEEHRFETDLYESILYILQERIEHIREKGIKKYVSDKACKRMLGYVVYVMIAAAILFPMMRGFELNTMDSFYVTSDGGKNYVIAIGNGNKYVLEQCDIGDDEIKINTNDVFVVSEPMKMQRMQFDRVEKD